MPSVAFRVEHDLLGEMEIPSDAYYGIHTLRAIGNFPLLGQRVAPSLIQAMAEVKKAAILSNEKLGYLPVSKSSAMIQACDEVIQGQWLEQFPLDALQGGAGTSTHMNLNEVIANRALEILGHPKGRYDLIHPLDDVNLHQSTNDLYPTAIKVASLRLLEKLSEKIARLQGALQKKEQEFHACLKLARTELQDAIPTTLGNSFSAFAEAIARDRWRIFKSMERLKSINLGGTAIGTGFGAPKNYSYLITQILQETTQLPLARGENLIDLTQNMDSFVEVSGILKAHAVNLFKIASDLRLLSSGPNAGLGEISLPPQQAGSSIMVGKVNPVIPEAITQVSLKVIGNDQIITQVGQLGQLELNAFLPLLAHSFLENLHLLIQANDIFRERSIEGIIANQESCHRHLYESASTLAILIPRIGYEKATQAALRMQKERLTLQEALQGIADLSHQEIDEMLQTSQLLSSRR